MTAKAIYFFNKEITAEEFNSVLPDKDILTDYEKQKPDVRSRIISRITRYLNQMSNPVKIVEIKYVLQSSNSGQDPEYYYLVKEEFNSKYYYMRYPIIQTPTDLYYEDCLIYQR